MPDTYQAERQSAKADIEAAGAPGKFVHRETLAETPASALILQFTLLERLGGLVVDGDGKFMVAALGAPDPVDPELYDYVIAASDPQYAASVGVYQIVNPNPFMPGGIPIYYELHVRRR